MARRSILSAALAALATTLFATAAFAHAGNAKFESLLRGVSPQITGFRAVVLNGDDRLEVVNDGPQLITIEGYSKEPYVRVQPDGTVSVNVRSPAYYLNADRDGETPVPDSADAKAPPQWKVVARDGRYEFHDHRIHWMAKGDPQQVTDTSARTKIVDWTIPLRADATAGTIDGTLFWRGSGGGPPAGAFAALAALALGGGAAVVVVSRRRRRGGETAAGPHKDAW